MSYEGARLEPWFHTGPNKVFCAAAAHAGGTRLTELVKMNTPINTGVLRESIEKLPLHIGVDEIGGHVAYESGAHTEVDYAPYVEHGTGLWGPQHTPYVIEPKKPGGTLHWVNDAGQDVFAKKVMHPGSPGQHMFSIGVAIAEWTIDSIVGPALRAWSREVERQNHSGLTGV